MNLFLKISIKCIIIFLIIISVVLVNSDILRAHPHVFITQCIDIIFDNKGMTDIKVYWSFDEMFSSMIIGDYDKNNNKKLESDEIINIKNGAFNNLKNFNYFSFLNINDIKTKVQEVNNFSARINKNKRLVYEFLVPCKVAAGKKFHKISFATYDSTYYTALIFTKNQPIELINSDPFEVKTNISEDKSTSIFYNTVHPWTLFIDFRLK